MDICFYILSCKQKSNKLQLYLFNRAKVIYYIIFILSQKNNVNLLYLRKKMQSRIMQFHIL